jgi:parvulin-like peptidyl-prolyl cis-trans isomerase-like protein
MMTFLKAVAREPIVHFLLAGLALFTLYNMVSAREKEAGESQIIVVDRAVLLTHIQHLSKVFEPQLAEARLDAMEPGELKRFIDDYIQEEALYREALALGLDADDYVLKRRLVQKVEFLAQGLAGAATDLDDPALEAFLEANKQDYFIQPTITFAHVFFDAEKRGLKEAEHAARRELSALNSVHTGFTDAAQYGDRFLYHVNYVDRTQQDIASHCGKDMAKAVFALKADGEKWRGPYASPYGFHLVLVTKSESGRTPALTDIRDRVAEDARRTQMLLRAQEAIDTIVSSYDVRIRYGPAQNDAATP